MSLTANEIESIIEELNYLKTIKSIEEINAMERFNDFKIKNKMFYEMIISGNMDPVIFKEMMKMKRRLESGEDQYSVDVHFGQFMAEKYIEPVTKKLKK